MIPTPPIAGEKINPILGQTNMRSVTFVDRLTLEVSGNIAQNAVCLGDVDNDGGHELVVGNEEGELLVFKGSSSKVWKRCSDLGFITAIGIGDLLNQGSNVLVVVSGCGLVSIFDFAHQGESLFPSDTYLAPIHKQRIPSNVKDLILCDMNEDGNIELVVSLTDRVVRSYKWVPSCQDDLEEREKEEVSEKESSDEGQPTGRLVSINKWEFASQIGTVTCNTNNDGSPSLLVAQPGGAFIKLRVKPGEESKEDGEGEDVLSTMSVEYEPLGVNRRRNPNVSAEILGGFRSSEDGLGTRYAILTLDGTLLLVDDNCGSSPEGSIMWNLMVDHQLMCLSKLDVTGNGYQEVIACSWDGQTYIVSQEREGVKFQFEENVSTFVAGQFTLSDGATVPVLVYVTFSGKIQVYHNITLDKGITLSTLVHYPGSREGTGWLVKATGGDPQNMKHLQQMYSYCLYGLPGPDRRSDT